MLQQRSGVAPGLLAQIVVSKYVHHLPLYRQEQIYWTQNRVWLPRQNLAHWIELAADWLKPIYERIRTGVMGGGYVQVDETPVRYLMPGNGKAKTGYFWTTSRPQGDVCTSGKPAARRPAWITCCRSTSGASYNATAIRATRARPS